MGWAERAKPRPSDGLNWAKVAIIGTAQSWAMTPWADRTLTCLSLNDAYRMPGFVRADAWFDIHPMDKFFFVPPGVKQIHAHQVPFDQYTRPADHLAWLARQPIPVYLHPDYRRQYPPASDWAHARAFPKDEIEVAYGRYFTSTPSWLLALAHLRGCRHVEIYGIHLQTQAEYIEQRPGFEYLIGRVLGDGRVTMTTAKGLRRYETADGVVILPEASPILQARTQYAFDPNPRRRLEPLQWELQKYQIKRERAIKNLKTAAWWQRTKIQQEALWHIEAVTADLHEQLGRLQDEVQRG